MVFGADEAGRGPVLGPMVVAAVAVPGPDRLPDGIDDSKAIAAERRVALARTLREDDAVRIAVERVSPDAIDAGNLTTLGIEATARAIAAAVTTDEAGLVDAADTDPERYARRVADAVADACGPSVTIEAAHGADAADPVVGAASVIAKVERDAAIDRLADEYGAIGSGYPSDPTTRSFLAEYVERTGDLPPFARRSWATCRDVLAAAEQSSLGEF
ncbi:ribonuclease HII [Halobacteriales archaeon SW_7_68_16]|nr:MAG: ribonuclease HII [Halobacteriales archaeon SW_7_68_16]